MLPTLNYRARKADVDALREYPRNTIHLDTYWGSDANLGTDWDHPVQTMTRALALVETGGRVLFKGKVTEQVTGSNLKFDITIQGVGSLHHADQPGSGSALYDYGASVWQPPSSPTAATPLLDVRGRGWKFVNILFDGPSDAACLRLNRNSSSGTSENDASHASIIDCDFRNGLYGIQNYDGCYNVTVKDNVFETFDATTSGAALITTANTGVAATRRWRIVNNLFQPDTTTEGNERHIVMDLSGSLVANNFFGTVKNTGKYIDLTNGGANILFGNVFMGAYDTSDYVGATGDSWVGNWIQGSYGTNTAGYTVAAPAGAT